MDRREGANIGEGFGQRLRTREVKRKKEKRGGDGQKRRERRTEGQKVERRGETGKKQREQGDDRFKGGETENKVKAEKGEIVKKIWTE